MRRTKQILVAGLATAGLYLAVVPVASAHDYCGWHGDDVGCVKDNHSRVDSCDREADGHYVRAWYKVGEFDVAGEWDYDGAGGTCGHAYTSFAYAVRLCEQVVGCSSWVYE